MKRFFLPVLIVAVSLAGCSKSFKLKKGSPAYTLAKEIAVKLPYLDPDKNNALLATKKFNVTSGEVFEEIVSVYGKESEQMKNMGPDQIKLMLEQAAQSLAEKRILLVKAKKMKINVTQAQADSLINEAANQQGGRSQFEESYKQRGIGMDVVLSMARDQLTIDRYFYKHFEKEMQVTEDEIQKAYSEGGTATVRHILLLTQGKNEDEKKALYQKMEIILGRIQKGEDISKLARLYSEDPGSKQEGGLVKNFKRGDMQPAFDDAAFSVPIGGTSGIFETVYGFHVLKVVKRDKDARPLDSVREDYRKLLNQRKRMEIFPKIQTLMDSFKQEYVFTVKKY